MSAKSSVFGNFAPNFIIAGAMKSGTTSLHAILNSHPDIFIPDVELHYFDHDNIIQHPDFNYWARNNWYGHQGQQLQITPSDWYKNKFSLAQGTKFLGEDSTTYLCSPKAIQRALKINPELKLLVMLRHPTKRAYSQYWHLVRTGRAQYSFEKTLMYFPEQVVGRSMYLEQFQLLYQYIDKSQVKVILFEDFITHKQLVVQDALTFIGVDSELLPDESYDLHENSAKLPRFIRLQLLKNKLFRQTANIHYRHHFLDEDQIKSIENSFFAARCVNKAHAIVNPLIDKKPPKIKASTEHFLNEFFKRHLDGLDDEINLPACKQWFKD